MLRKQVHSGLLIKLLTDYSNVPAGTWATVNAVGTMDRRCLRALSYIGHAFNARPLFFMLYLGRSANTCEAHHRASKTVTLVA